jgi:Type II CAAX prenyl endopeptidase Rce1-like
MEQRRPNPNPVNSSRYPWRLFWLLSGACVLGIAAALPYIYALFRHMIVRSGSLPMPLPVLVTAQLMQSAIVFGGIVALGILLAGKAGIDAPILHRWLYRTGQGYPAGWVRTPLAWGVALGVITFLSYLLVFFPLIPEWPWHEEAALPVWKRFFICLYGGINIELLMRFFLLSLFLWLLKKITRDSSPRPRPGIFWIANTIVALIYAAGHLPAAKSLMPLTPIVLTAVLLPTAIAGLAFGYLTWKRGIEAAMLAHFSSDFVAHVIGPMLLR